MSYRYCVWLPAFFFLITACGNEDKKPPVNQVSGVKPTLMQPFRFHKAVEVSPGQTYDVLSWGRGPAATGSFAILHSDSAHMKYTTTTGDLDGSITDVYNADMDLDGNPEILIQSKGKDTVNYAKVYAFEFNDNMANQLDFPKLSNIQKRGYRGNDNFYIREGKLIREFPLYDGSNAQAEPTGHKRQLEYSLRGNNFTVRQLSNDPVTEDGDKPVVNDKPVVTTRKRTLNQSKKRRKAEPRKKKRGRRHRN